VKDFSSEIGGTLKNLGSQLLAGFQVDELTDIFR
jgi:hypothetical protein